MDFLEKLLPFLASNGVVGGAIALALVWYLKHRDASEKRASEASGVSTETVSKAILEMAAHSARQTEILGQQTRLLEACRDGHHDTQKTLVEVKTKLDVMRTPSNGRVPH